MILVGSRAREWYSVNGRPPKDWDFIMTLQEIFDLSVNHADFIEFMYPKNEWKFKGRFKSGDPFEIEVANYNPSAMWLWERRMEMLCAADHVHPKGSMFDRFVMYVPDLGYQAKMKRSHLYWPVHWDKSIDDYHMILMAMQTRDDDFNEEHDEFYRLRLAENEAKFGPIPKVNYQVSNEEFFKRSSAAVQRVFDHDELHEAVKFYQEPMFLVAKTDKSQAALDECVIKLLSHEQRIALVAEEAMVIALERVVIPQTLTGAPVDPEKAIHYAMRRLCTNLSDGYFREFALDNWREIVVACHKVDFITKFREHFHR